jgi:pimeloyl-ACP methyl ester carboxylesterase
MKQQPKWLDKELYPFQSHWINIDGNEIHYVSEGSGDVILFVHGTPEWSFGYRDLIKDLRADYRCVALDLLGFGLSDKPAAGDFTVKAQADRLQKFIDRLELKNITLVANDFGGGIGVSYALRHPDNVSRIILFNTWMRSLRNDKHYSGPSRVINSWLGKVLYLNLNFAVKILMPASFGDKRKLTRKIHDHYKNALPDSCNRLAPFVFAKEIMNASEWWQSQWEQLHNLSRKPVLIFWGMKDTFVPMYELENWQSKLPNAKIVTFEDAGHFVHEEKPTEMLSSIRDFLLGL